MEWGRCREQLHSTMASPGKPVMATATCPGPDPRASQSCSPSPAGATPRSAWPVSLGQSEQLRCRSCTSSAPSTLPRSPCSPEGPQAFPGWPQHASTPGPQSCSPSLLPPFLLPKKSSLVQTGSPVTSTPASCLGMCPPAWGAGRRQHEDVGRPCGHDSRFCP